MNCRSVALVLTLVGLTPLIACEDTRGQAAAIDSANLKALTGTAADSLSSRAASPPPSAAPSPAAPSHGAWEVDESTDEMDDVKNVVLSLYADSPLGLPFPYHDDIPAIVIRCQKNHTDLYVVTRTPVQTSYGYDYDDLGAKIRLRLDGGRPETSYWSEATDHAAVFAPNPVGLARRLAHTQHLLVEFTPFESGPITTSFETDGLGVVLGKVSAACHWK